MIQQHQELSLASSRSCPGLITVEPNGSVIGHQSSWQAKQAMVTGPPVQQEGTAISSAGTRHDWKIRMLVYPSYWIENGSDMYVVRIFCHRRRTVNGIRQCLAPRHASRSLAWTTQLTVTVRCKVPGSFSYCSDFLLSLCAVLTLCQAPMHLQDRLYSRLWPYLSGSELVSRCWSTLIY